ncbi:hypothetical protein PQX77_005271 [Marasmius sp. AFHP31]|nr:hypothetical protein PQX77_005271 [Marasmius sp. AFHP31]
MSTFFSNAQNPSISGGVFSHVQRDQYNNYTGRARTKMITSASPNQHIAAAQETDSAMTTTMVVHVNGNQVNQIIQQEGEHTEFDDYRNVKSGDFCRLEDVCVVEYLREPWRYGDPPTANKTICAVKVIGTEGTFTSVTYSGPDARRAFEEDFRKVSRARSSKSSAQVFAVDVGTVPSVLFWHGLLPISHFERSLGWLGGIYIYTLCRKLKCLEEELWVDFGRGVICQGPEGPRSHIGWMEGVEVEKLPLTAEMLQTDVFMRFLASQKLKQADQAFLNAMWYGNRDDDDEGDDNDEGVPELFDQPTIFSTLAKTPVAVANNVWTSEEGFTERKALENGLTRFQLEEDGSRLMLWLNGNARLAWLSQSSNIFQSCGISLDDDLSVYGASMFCVSSSTSQHVPEFVCREAYLEGYLDDSPPKSQRRRQQPIYLFVYLPPPDLSNGRTSCLNFWSFHEHGQHRLSPESCLDFGLPIGLAFSSLSNQSQKFSNYKLIHRYQQLRGFDPTTTDFAQHLGYDDNIFQPIHHSDCFMEASQEHSNSLDEFVTSDSSECLSDRMDQQLAEDPTSMTSNQGQITSREDGATINSHCVTNKRQRRNTGYEGIARNDPEPELRHENDATNNHDPAMDGHNPQLVQLLPTRFQPFPYLVNSHPPIPLNYSHPPQGHQSQLQTSYYHNNQPPYPYPPRPAYPSLGDVPFASRAVNMVFPTTSDLSSFHLQLQGWPESSQNSAAATYFDALPAFNAYNSAEIANTASNLSRSTMDLGHTASGAYPSVSTTANAFRYDLAATQNTGWSGTSHVEGSAPGNMLYSGSAYTTASNSMPAVTHPFNSAYPANVTYSLHHTMPSSHAHDPDYPSPFSHGRGSPVLQQHWSPPFLRHDPSYNPSSFSSPAASYLSDSTVRAQTHLPYSAHTPQGHLSMFPSDGGNPLVPHQPWNTPADHTQQYTYEPSMQSTQSSPWNQTSGEYGEGNGASGW